MISTTNLSDELNLVLLQTAVHECKPLRAVKDQADQFKAHSGAALSLEQYLNLLQSAAINLDASTSPKRSILPKQRQVLEHNMDSYDYQDDPDPLGFDIDSPIDVIQAYIDGRCTPLPAGTLPKCAPTGTPSIGNRLAPVQWAKLSPPGRLTWDLLSDEDKRVVLNPPPPRTSWTPRSAQLHALDPDPYTDTPTFDHHMDDYAEFEDALSAPPDNHLSAYPTAIQDAHPSDMRKMLSSSGKPPS